MEANSRASKAGVVGLTILVLVITALITAGIVIGVAFELCGALEPCRAWSIIGVDSPWEDFTPRPIASFLYWFIDVFIKSRY